MPVASPGCLGNAGQPRQIPDDTVKAQVHARLDQLGAEADQRLPCVQPPADLRQHVIPVLRAEIGRQAEHRAVRRDKGLQRVKQAVDRGFCVEDHQYTVVFLAAGGDEICNGGHALPARDGRGNDPGPPELPEPQLVVRHQVHPGREGQRVFHTGQIGLSGGTQDHRAAEQPRQGIQRKIQQAGVPQRQGLHFVQQQYRTGQRRQPPHILARGRKQCIQQLDHRCADHRHALPALAQRQPMLLRFLLVRRKQHVGVVLQHPLCAHGLPDVVGILPGDGFVRRKVEQVPGILTPGHLQAKAQPGIGLAAAGGHIQPVDPRRAIPCSR